MKKVLHIISSLSGGGRERRMSQLVKGMAGLAGYEIHIVVFSLKNDYLIDYPADKIHLVDKTQGKLSFAKTLRRKIKSISPDVVHLWTEITPSIYLALMGCHKYRFIFGSIADGNPVRGLFHRFLVNRIYKKSDAIVSNSKAGLIAKKAPLEKSHVIYNGFDFARLSAKSFDEKALRKELNVEDKRVVTMVARFDRAKNWEMFLSIASSFSSNSDVVFVAVGDGPLIDENKKEATENVVFAGRRNDVENILKIADVSLLFSNSEVHAEGVSNSIMESMAAGVPVIATRGGGTTEIITDSKNGYVVEPNDATTAAEKLNQLLGDSILLDEMSRCAVEEIRSRFLLTDMTDHYVELYNKLLKK